MIKEVSKPQQLSELLREAADLYTCLDASPHRCENYKLIESLKFDRVYIEGMTKIIAEIDALDPALLKPEQRSNLADYTPQELRDYLTGKIDEPATG